LADTLTIPLVIPAPATDLRFTRDRQF